ncbi:MAG: PorT family protein [Dysgonamonadaceae bacterium]|jgi:hypothetical protein|nr:PorT family protein [Dysgonamonadaceae bacterium]
MQKANHSIKEDNFRRIIKEKLEGYSLPVSDNVWDKIEKNLDNKPRKIVLWPWISGTVAAAAAVLLALLLFPINEKKISHYETTNLLSEYEETTDKNVPVETIGQPVSASDVKPERIFVTRKTKGEYAEAGSRPKIDVIESEIVPEKEPEVPSQVSEPQVEDARAEKTDRLEKVVYPDIDPFGDDSSPVKKSPKRKSISLSLGSAGSLMAMNANSTDNMAYNDVIGQLRSNFYADESESRTEERLLIEDFPEATHRIPLSFGLTVKKELNRTFSLETGLVYTFLDSRFENRSWEREALLQLHYLGIPLNVQARILGDKKSDWEVYLSAGGMIEKGIYSHYKQTNHAGGSDILTIISNEKINGLQYSISFAPGIDYKIYRNYSVYFEPKISYYFDTKQPVSARTEHPVVVGVNVGLRLGW